MRAPTGREQPAIGKLYRQDEILKRVSIETKKTIAEILHTKGSVRQLTMGLLYRYGGLKNKEIGALMGVDYSTVSQGRKRLREKLLNYEPPDQLLPKLKAGLARINICPPRDY